MDGKFKVPAGTPADQAIKMLEREVQLLWERVNVLLDELAVFPPQETCGCVDPKYFGHNAYCKKSSGGGLGF